MNAMALRCRLYDMFSGTGLSLDKACDYAFLEAALSPAKYALFQILGFYFIRTIGLFDVPSTISMAYSAKIGCFAGIMLGTFYLSLLSRRGHAQLQDISDLGPFAAFSNLSKEMAFTAIVSVISASLHGLDDRAELFYLAISGILGPAVFLMILFSMLGMVIGIAWCLKTLKHRCVRYD